MGNALSTLSVGTVAAGLAVLVGLFMVYAEVRVITAARRRDAAWTRLEKCLKERSAVAPQLISIATFYLSWNDPLVVAVGATRREALRARGVTERTCREADLSWALGRLMATLEGQPMLARHAGLKAIRAELDRAENAAAVARLTYNHAAETLERLLATPMPRLVARLTRQTPPEPFEVDPYLVRMAMMSRPVAPPASRVG
jgi:hypothetical protein